LRLQSKVGQDLCAAEAAEHLIFKTSTEEQTVDLTNKGMTKDSLSFSRWFHSVWIKRELKRKLMQECRCDGRLRAKAAGSTRLVYTGFPGPGLSHSWLELSPNFLSFLQDPQECLYDLQPSHNRHKGDVVRGTIIIVCTVCSYFVSGSLI
jgi:hypothetical protein